MVIEIKAENVVEWYQKDLWNALCIIPGILAQMVVG